MAIIRTSEVTPGMVLAVDARDMSGRLLLAAGGEVTPKHLKIFKTWGVTEVDVQEMGSAGTQPEPGTKPEAGPQPEAGTKPEAGAEPGAEVDDEEVLDLTDYALDDGPDQPFRVKATIHFCQNDRNHPLIRELFDQCVERLKVQPPPAPKQPEPPAKPGRRSLPQSSQGGRHGRR